ncbi:hypothetical protein GCM10009775_35310 [Microbacterium aoyamense]|uniref:Uncharacterized protein n=1 Tax=Microbacterium aoyamense TaxID=344166 RepID=A0ABN2Q0K7_9MICO|nr:hypothetical protein [Microbacterium aoyamense]
MACRCEALPGSNREPTKEQDAGTVRILSTSEPGWDMTYELVCASCARRYTVRQTDGPATQWKWVPHGLKRRRGEV